MDDDVQFTEHAKNMLKERKFTKKLIVDTVLNPDSKDVGEQSVWYAIRKLEHKVLRVVVTGEQKPYTVITMYYDRRLAKTMMSDKKRRNQNES